MFAPRKPNVRTAFERDPGQIHRPLPLGPLLPFPAPRPAEPEAPDSEPTPRPPA